MIRVVGAAIVRDGRVLAARRSYPAAAAGRWELPGGKVSPGESPDAALTREIAEELGCAVTVDSWLPESVRWCADDVEFELRVALCRLVEGEPHGREHDALRWLSPAALDDVDWLEPDRPFVAALRHHPYDAGVTNQGLTTRIVLARHGEAAYPSGDGADAGGVLTELGRSQARDLGEWLRDQGIAAIVCSELSRAQQTAEIVAEILHLRVEVRSGLHEYRAGDEPYDVRSIGAALMAWLGGDLQARMLGGESGEEVTQRVRAVLDDLVRANQGRTVLVVMHGGAIIATLGSIAPGRTGLPTDGDPYRLEQDMQGGASFAVEHRPDGWAVLPRTTP